MENLARLALPVIGKLAALPRARCWGDWIAALVDLAEFTLREPERVADLLEELEPMSESVRWTLAEVLLVLGPRLNSLRAEPEGVALRQSVGGGIEESRGPCVPAGVRAAV